MRYLVLFVVSCVLTGCIRPDVVLTNPRTSEIATCAARWREINPWSQADACVGSYEAQGWVIIGGR